MSVKTWMFFTSIMIMILFSLSAMASESHLVHAIKHAEAAAAAADGKAGSSGVLDCNPQIFGAHPGLTRQAWLQHRDHFFG